MDDTAAGFSEMGRTFPSTMLALADGMRAAQLTCRRRCQFWSDTRAVFGVGGVAALFAAVFSGYIENYYVSLTLGVAALFAHWRMEVLCREIDHFETFIQYVEEKYEH